jgi:hypothetical protein
MLMAVIARSTGPGELICRDTADTHSSAVHSKRSVSLLCIAIRSLLVIQNLSSPLSAAVVLLRPRALTSD